MALLPASFGQIGSGPGSNRKARRPTDSLRIIRSWQHREMVGLPTVELLIRVSGRTESAPNRVPRLRRAGIPWRGEDTSGSWWSTSISDTPALAEVLSTCHGFRVDDAHGNTIGMVEQVVMAPDTAGPVGLIVRAWNRQWVTVPLDDVLDLVPGRRRLVIASRPATSR